MELSKAKTVLIIAFLVLNIYLAYQIWVGQEFVLSYAAVSSEEVERVMDLLVENNYLLTTTLPRQTQKMSLFSVRAPAPEKEKYRQAFFAEEEKNVLKRRQSNDEIVYTYQGKILVFHDNGQIIFRSSARPEEINQLPLEKLKQQTKEFLDQVGLLPVDAEFDAVYPISAGEQVVRFYQVYEGIPLYASYINVYYLGNYLSRIEFYWLKPLGFSGESRPVISASQALFSFLEAWGPAVEPVEIIEITLGYYSQEYEAEKWEVVPVWRIITDTKEVTYVNAFSGEKEGELKTSGDDGDDGGRGVG